jgi:broad specificity phosphatase PhoE
MAEDYDNLSLLGIEQSKSLGSFLRKEKICFDRIYLGPLKRHFQTFEHCFRDWTNGVESAPIILDGLKEHNGSEALQVYYDQLDDDFEIVRKWKKKIEERPEDKKRLSLRIFRLFMSEWMAGKIEVDHDTIVPFDRWKAEVYIALEQVLSSVNSNETIGIFTSGGTKGAIIAKALGIDDGRQIANLNDSLRNTSMSHFNYSRLGFNVLSFNEIPHLSKDQITYV